MDIKLCHKDRFKDMQLEQIVKKLNKIKVRSSDYEGLKVYQQCVLDTKVALVLILRKNYFYKKVNCSTKDLNKLM